jgi:hypothetical protein
MLTPHNIKTAIQIEQRIENRKEKREFTKKAAIALLYAGNLPNQNACRKAIEFTEIFFNELNEKQ